MNSKITTSILDSRELATKLDTQNVLGSIEQLGQQVQHIHELTQDLESLVDPSTITSVVVAGMGGSVLGTHVIQTLFKDELKVPLLVCPDYHLPHFVNEHTLVVASSYSGTTEETLSATKEAIEKGATVCGITTGGPLSELLAQHNAPAIVFEPTYNPSGAPRLGLGYSIFGQIALLAKLGVLTMTDGEYSAVLETVAHAQLASSFDVPQGSNPAKLLAFQLSQQLPIVVASEHLEGTAHVLANMLNENAKTFSEYRIIPELNHHLMEGLQFPDSNETNLTFVTIGSELYDTSNQKRMDLTEKLLEKHNLDFLRVDLQSQTKIEQNFELLVLGAYTSFYLALLNNQDPGLIPNVDWFKSELKSAV